MRAATEAAEFRDNNKKIGIAYAIPIFLEKGLYLHKVATLESNGESLCKIFRLFILGRLVASID